MTVVLSASDLLVKANEMLQMEPWSQPSMRITKVEQIGFMLLLHGKGFSTTSALVDAETLKNLNALAQRLAEEYRLPL